MASLLNGTPYCCGSCITLRLTLQLYGQHDFHFVGFKITHVFANYPVHSVVGASMANCSCRKRRHLNGELRASCQETCTVRGSTLLPRTLGKCEKNVWEDTWRKVSYISWENEWTCVVYRLKTIVTSAFSRNEWSNRMVNWERRAKKHVQYSSGLSFAATYAWEMWEKCVGGYVKKGILYQLREWVNMCGILLEDICYKCSFEKWVVQQHCWPESVSSIHSSVNYTGQNMPRVLNSLGYGHIGRDFIGITDRTKSSDKYSHIRTVTMQAYKYYFQ